MAEGGDDYERGGMDVSMQQRTYEAVMAFSGFWGVPAALGLTAMFTALATRSGLAPALAIGLVVFIAVRAIFKLFFK